MIQNMQARDAEEELAHLLKNGYLFGLVNKMTNGQHTLQLVNHHTPTTLLNPFG